jgi:hypothetical protein
MLEFLLLPLSHSFVPGLGVLSFCLLGDRPVGPDSRVVPISDLWNALCVTVSTYYKYLTLAISGDHFPIT